MTADESAGFSGKVRGALVWRAGSQAVAQLLMWASTFLVIRLLDPSDYGLFAMTQIVLSLMSLMNGYSFTGALVQASTVDKDRVRQVFGMLLAMNGGLAAAQFLLAPAAAAYFREPVVADMLRVQSVLHLLTPLIMMPQALMSREIDFRSQGRANIAAALLAAGTALGMALSGFGVWTLVVAPLVLFSARAALLVVLGRWWVWPSFRWTGAGAVFTYGGAMLTSEMLWFVQTQADIFVGGRALGPHQLGIYTTALFLAQILVNKLLPPLNEVAFPAYARLQADRSAVAWSFAKSVRLIMLVAVPWSVGMAVTAGPLVLTVLGPKWAEAAPVVAVLALAMPFVVLRTLYNPATNALGRPGTGAFISAIGAAIMVIGFVIGVRWGPIGLGLAWLVGMPLLTIVSSALSLPIIGLPVSGLLAALRPALAATGGMAATVLLVDMALPPLAPAARLAALVAAGGVAYAGILLGIAPALVRELAAMVRRQPVAATA